MELLESLGINGKVLIAQIVNFLILVFVLRKFAYGPIVNLLEKRRRKIAQGLEDAEKAADSLQSAEEKAKDITEKAYAEAKQIARDTKSQAEKEAREIIAKADKQADQILSLANEEAAKAKEKALAEVRQHMANLIILSLEKIIGSELNNEQRERLAAKAVEEL